MTTATKSAPKVAAASLEPKITLELVTPAQAAEWLNANESNRPLRRAKVQAFARDMIAGSWRVTTETVKFDRNGKLVDGQHRLTALVVADMPVRMHVARGVDAGIQKVIDSGTARTAGDTLKFMGVRNWTNLAALARLAIGVEQQGGYNNFGKAAVTHTEIEKWVEQNSGADDFVSMWSGLIRRIPVLVPSIGVYAAWEMHKLDAQVATNFFHALTLDAPAAYDGDPALALFRRFSQAAAMREAISRMGQLSMLYRAWNARAKGDQLIRIQLHNRHGDTIAVPKLVKP